MLKSYLKAAFRNLGREKGYALVNVGGLAMALAVGLLTVAWAQYELSFDRFHGRADSIYRFVVREKTETGWRNRPAAPIPLAAILRESLPEVRAVAAAQYNRPFYRFASSGTVDFKTSVLLAEPSFLTMFDFPLLKGDRRSALDEVGSILLTESAARKFFGTADPMGQTLLAMDKKIPMKVTGVLKDIPETSHLRFDALTPMSSIELWWDPEKKWNIMADWDYKDLMYVLLKPGTDIASFEAKVAAVVKEHDPPPGRSYSLSLQPLKRIHLFSNYSSSFQLEDVLNPGPLRIRQVRAFLLIALAVLIMACINSTNMAASRSLKRVREIGVRKTSGATRRDIVGQMLVESAVFALIALAAALILALLLLPLLRLFTGRELDLRSLDSGRLLLSAAGLALFTGVVSGIYPALLASSLAPVSAMKKTFRPDGRSFIYFRRALIAAQIACSTTLIVVTSVFALQLRYLETKDLGFDRRDVVTFPLFSMRNQLDAFKAELLRSPAVLSVAGGFRPTLRKEEGHFRESRRLSWEGKSPESNVIMDWIFVDDDYVKTYGLTMSAGRFFSKDFPGDKNNFVVNESAVKAMGLKDPVGKRFSWGEGKTLRQGVIVGVVKDFHVNTLKAKIIPMFFVFGAAIDVAVRIDPRRTQEALQLIGAAWRKFVPDRPFEYEFLDEALSAMYGGERRSGRIISIFSALSVAISCLGLFGLVAFMAERRTKEIGIRKVLGASVTGIVRLMTKEFAALAGVAVVVAWPAGYLIAGRWLSGFAYRVPLSWWIFAGSGLLVFALTLATTSLRALRAAAADPVDSLRYE